MTIWYAVRYFHIVPVVPPLMNVAFAIAVGAGALRLMGDGAAVTDALAPVLWLQLLVASSGFRFAARRGYYDLLLTSGTPRWQIALAHCLVSVTPGLASWLCVAALELAINRGSRCISLSAGTCAAFIGASLTAWSVAVFSSRTATAVIWLLVMTIPAVARLLSPIQLLGVPWSTDRLVLVAALGAGAAMFAAAVVLIVRAPIPLEAAQ